VKEVELTERKRAILAAIVNYHIATGCPVGSKWLTGVLENAPSSATLRNEMSELSSMGFLEQPHTSAGRIPTGKGYEFYVSNLMQKDELPASVKEMIDSLMAGAVDTETLHLTAAKILSRITGLPAFTAKVADESVRVERIEIMPMSSHLVMLVAITDDGRAISKLFRSNLSLYGKTGILEKLIKDNIEGKPLYLLTAGEIQNISVRAGIDALSLMPIIASLFDMLKEMGQSKVDLAGETYLYNMLGSQSRVGRLLSFIERKEGIMSLIDNPKDKVGIIFGNATAFSELNGSAVIVTSFGSGNNPLGRIGVIGPTRMSYGQLVPIVSYIADILNNLMSENLDKEEK
jgi:heat-inducible transcriptional repressor